MKKANILLTFLMLIGIVSSCNLSRTAVVRDTVKSVATTTADYYDFYLPGIGEGKVKCSSGTIDRSSDNPDLIITVIPATAKADEGYYIVKPAFVINQDMSIAPGSPAPGEISLKRSDLTISKFVQRGN